VDELASARRFLLAEGHDARYLHLDVTSEQNWPRWWTRDGSARALDILFKQCRCHPFRQRSRTITVDIWTASLAFMPRGFSWAPVRRSAMRKGGGGRSSIRPRHGHLSASPTSPAYSAAKGAITNLHQVGGAAYAKENIRIKIQCIRLCDTPLTVKRFNDPAVRKKCSIARRWGGSAPPRISPMACSFLASGRLILGHRLGTGRSIGGMTAQ